MQYNQKVRGRNWTSPEIENLVNLYKSGQNIEQIALSLDRTPGGVAARLFKEGVISKVSDALGYKKSEFREREKRPSLEERLVNIEAHLNRLEEMIREQKN